MTSLPTNQGNSFLDRVRSVNSVDSSPRRGRLIFALDATASRQPTWNMARKLQGEMFLEAEKIGCLDVQLVYFRSDECQASRWISEPKSLATVMDKIHCLSGKSQIGKVLSHAYNETQKAKVQALIFVGDSFEEDEDQVAGKASDLGLSGVPVFMFQEGDGSSSFGISRNSDTERIFRHIARLTRGAYFRFDDGAADVLRELLGAAAAYATRGMKALNNLSSRNAGAVKLLEQMKR